MLPRRLALLGAVFVSAPVFRYGLPSEIRLIVPSAAGGTADALGRTLATHLSARLRRSFIPERCPGAHGDIATRSVAEGTPDGSIFGLATPDMTTIPPHRPTSPTLDIPSDLTPVAKIADVALILVANPGRGITSFETLVETAGRSPAGVVCGSPAAFGVHHLGAAMLAKSTDVTLTHVSCHGCAPTLADVLDGTLPLASIDLVAALPYIRSGRLVAIGVLTTGRARIAPDIHCLSEIVPEFPGVPSWYGLFAPKETPDLLVDPIAAELEGILWDRSVVDPLLSIGLEVAFVGGQRFRTLLADEIESWKAVAVGLDQPTSLS